VEAVGQELKCLRVTPHNQVDLVEEALHSFLLVGLVIALPYLHLKDNPVLRVHQDSYLLEVAEPQVEEVVQVVRQVRLVEQVLQLQ
jgi:hypothetical protein